MLYFFPIRLINWASRLGGSHAFIAASLLWCLSWPSSLQLLCAGLWVTGWKYISTLSARPMVLAVRHSLDTWLPCPHLKQWLHCSPLFSSWQLLHLRLWPAPCEWDSLEGSHTVFFISSISHSSCLYLSVFRLLLLLYELQTIAQYSQHHSFSLFLLPFPL